MAAWYARAAGQGVSQGGRLGALAERLAPPLALLLLGNMYLLGWRPLGEVVAAGLAILAVAALAGGVLAPRLGYGLLRWLGGGVVVVLVGGLVSPAVTMAAAGRGAWLLALAAACLVVACLLLRRWPAERLLRWLFLAGAASAAVSSGWFLAQGLAGAERLIPLGRAHNPIPAAAALAAAGLAGVALWRGRALAAPAALAGLVAIFLAMLLTQSRGPLLGFLAGLALLLAPMRAWRWWLPPLLFLAASCLVPAEGVLRDLFCTDELLACRPSLRQDLWSRSAALIATHPLAGLGVTYRLGADWLNNPQNAVLGLALYFGLPFAALALAGWLRLLRATPAAALPGPRWARAMMAFSAVYFAFEPSPFGYYNAHYVFFWLPLAMLSVEATSPR